jgi:hypothetical protein
MMRELRWSVIVDDTQHWTPEHLAACERQDADFDDFAVAGLLEAMQAAGLKYMEAHPDLFRGDLV